MTSLLPILLPLIKDSLKRVLPADPEKQAEFDKEIRLSLLENAEGLEAARAKIILAEANSSSWLAATWRPLLMIIVVAIIAMNYLFFPILGLIFGIEIMIELPAQLWNLLTVGVGGYVIGRSGEKMMTSYVGDKKK